MNRFVFPILLLIAAFLPTTPLRAAPQWSGSVGYEFLNQQTQVALTADLIDNSSREDTTGTLEVQLWATQAPYESGQIHGALVGTAKLEGLSPREHYKPLRRVVPYTPPAQRGTYYMVMLLLEYRGGKYVIVQHSNMRSTANLGPLPLFTMDAPWRYQTSTEGGTVEINVAKISHRRTTNTGSLKLAVWATAEPYRGGSLRGYEIGEVRKDALKAGYTYNNVTNTAKYVKPPPGQYYVSLVLFEWNDNAFEVVAHLDMNTTAQF